MKRIAQELQEGLGGLSLSARQDANALGNYGAQLSTYMRFACPRRVAGHTYQTQQTAGRVRALAQEADAAVKNCDRAAYLLAIAGLRSLAARLEAQANQIVAQRGETEAALAEARRIQQDAVGARELADKLAREFEERFKNCPPEGRTTTPPTPALPPGLRIPPPPPIPPGTGTPALPGASPPGTTPGTTPPPPTPPPTPPEDPRRAGSQVFNELDLARQAREQLRKAEDAIRNCDRRAYLEAIGELQGLADVVMFRAGRVAEPRTRAALERAEEIAEEARRLRRLARELIDQFDARFGRCGHEPHLRPIGAAFPSTQNYAFNINAGGNVSWTPRVSGGTIIPQLGVAGTELPLVWSPKTLTGGGFQIDAKIPLGDPIGSGRDWMFIPRVVYGYADGHASGMIAPGGVFTGRTYLSPAPNGMTGLFYGATGQQIDIFSRTRQVAVDLLVGTRLFAGEVHGAQYHVFAGSGPSYRFTWTGHTIDERNLSFAGVWSRTEFETDDHFFGARFAGGVKVDKDRWHGTLTGHVTPGIVVSKGSAAQWNACSVCTGVENSFMLQHERSKAGFGVETGIGATLGYNLTRSIRLGGFMQFDYRSRQSNWRNPVTPQKSPPHLGVDGATAFVFGVRVVFFLP